MFVLALFGHIVGALILFAAFALEWAALRQLGRPVGVNDARSWVDFSRVLPRLSGLAAPVLLLTGVYMASQLRVWHSGWIRVSLATLVILAILGRSSGARMRALGRVSMTGAGASKIVPHSTGDLWLAASFRLRVSAMLAIVYLMVAQLDFVPSVTIVIASALAGAASTFRMWRATRGAAGERRPAEETGTDRVIEATVPSTRHRLGG